MGGLPSGGPRQDASAEACQDFPRMPQPRKSRRSAASGTSRREATREAVAQASKIAEARDAARSIEAPRQVRARGGERDPFTGELRKREVLPLLVLHFISDGPSYGNQLMDRISAVTAGRPGRDTARKCAHPAPP